MIDHTQRQHTEWAASATARNVQCAGAIAMCSMVDARDSEAAAWGTATHEIADACLKAATVDPEFFRGQVKKVGRFAFEVDDEMIDCAAVYIDICTDEIALEPCVFWVEEKLSLEALSPPLPAGGTGDLVLYRPRSKRLKIIDLKGGRGVFVDAANNGQLRTYAIGALLAHADLDVETVEVMIVQPRLHRDGDQGVRSETFHVADLYEWTATLLGHMARAAAAKTEFQRIGGNRVLFDAWAEKWLQTGQCTFCDAQALCPKLRAEALATLPHKMQAWFEDLSPGPPPELSNAAMLLSTEELAKALDGLDMIGAWVKAVRERGHSQAERGVAIPGWALYDKFGNRAWKDEAATEKKLRDLGLGADAIFNRKLKSPAQAEKALGPKRKSEIDDLWEKPNRGRELARVGKSNKAPVTGKIEQHFENLEK